MPLPPATAISPPGCQHHLDYDDPEAWEQLERGLEERWDAVPTQQCGLLTCDPGWSWSMESVDYDLWCVLGGQGVMDVADRKYEVEAGSLIALRPGDVSRAVHDPKNPLRVVYSHFIWREWNMTTATISEAMLPSRRVQLRRGSRVPVLLSKVARLGFRSDPLDRVRQRLALQEALLDVYRDDAIAHGAPEYSRDPRIARAVDTVREQPGSRWTLDELGDVAGMTPRYFSRVFRTEVGMSVRAFLLETRLERADMLLRETSARVGEVARALGYRDARLFSAQYVAHFGRRPSDVRQGHGSV